MARRYKQVACIYCGTIHTSNEEHPLCPQCRDDIRLGRERRKEVDALREAGEIKDVWLGDRWLHHQEADPATDSTQLRRRVMNSVLGMCGSMSGEFGHGTWEGNKHIANPASVSVSSRYNSFHDDKGRRAILPSDRVDALLDFTDCITALLSYEYHSGFKDGSSFLSRLARGDMSMDHLNERLDKNGRR